MFLPKLVQFALKNKNWVLATAMVVAIWGVVGLPKLPIDAVPDITNVQVVVNTKTGALDPEKIELLVTRPVETEMSGMPGLEEVRSISKYGLSQVTLVFSDGTDIYWARQQIMERLQNIRGGLPERASPELAPISTGLGEVFMYAVEAKAGSELSKKDKTTRLTELRTIQDFVIRPQLKRLAGVADVDTNGGFQKEIHINFFPDRLERAGISAEGLVAKLATLGESAGGGYIQREGRQIIVRTVPGIPNLELLKQFPLGLSVSGRPIRLSQVAEVRVDHSLRVGAALYNGKETVLGTVLMRVGANSREVAQHSEEAIRSIEIPAEVEIIPLYSRSFLVNATIQTVSKNLAEGAALVILVLLLMLGHFRAAVLVALAIPISMLVAIRGMMALGISANLMSLGAIDFGLLVDGSVVLIENILSRLQARAKRGLLQAEEKRDIVFQASSEVIQPVVFGLILIMVVYVPILTLEGIEGKMFRPMALTVLLALGASLFVAVFLMPILAEKFITIRGVASGHEGEESTHDTWLFRWAKRLYQPTLAWSFRRRGVLVGSAVALLVLSLVLLTTMGSDFIPQLDEGDLVINLSRDPKESVDHSVEMEEKSAQVISSFPEVERVFSRLGTPETATDPMGVNLADVFVMLKKDRSQWKHKNKEELFEAIKQKLGPVGEQEITATQPIEMRFNEILEGSRADVTLRILGPNLGTLLESIQRAQAVIEKIPGTESVEFDALTALKMSEMMDITPNFSNLAKFGVALSEVNNLVELAMSGKEVGSFFENALRFPIVVHLDESLRERQDVIESLPVGLSQGGTIPLSQLASVSIHDRVTTIARSWSERYAALSINLRGRDISSFVKEAQEKITSGVKLQEGYRYYWGGQFKNLARARLRLWIIVPLTLLVVFLILLKAFGSFSQTLLIFTSIPFAVVGGIVSLYLRGIPLSISAAVGFIALIGIALLNSIVLLTVFRQLRESMKSELREIVKEGALSRLRPVLMTAFVASLGFIPMALNTGLGSEVQRPLATVVIGGLVTSTILTLLLLPCLYDWIESRKPTLSP